MAGGGGEGGDGLKDFSDVTKLPDFFPPPPGSEVFLDLPSLAVNFL